MNVYQQFNGTLYYYIAFIFFSCLFLLYCNSAETSNTDSSSEQEMNTQITPLQKDLRKRIIFFGNSLTAAYGLAPSQGFAALIQDKINTKQLDYKVVNAGISGETTAGGKERIQWILKQPIHIFLLELGANDILQGIPPDISKANLDVIIKEVKAVYPTAKIILAGMEAPLNSGGVFSAAFQNMYAELAEKHQAALIPHLLEDVGGISRLNQLDGLHPNAEGHQIVAENIWNVLAPLLHKHLDTNK